MSESKKKFKFTMPDTYVIIFGIIVIAWLSTFVVPVGQYSKKQVVFQEKSENPINITGIAEGLMPIFGLDDVAEAEKLINRKGATLTIKGIDPSNERAVRSLARANNGEAVRGSADAESFVSKFSKKDNSLVADNNGKKLVKPLSIFNFDADSGSSSGFLKFPFDGLKDMVSIVIFIIIIGGAFGIIIKTGAIETGILAVIKKIQGFKILVIPILFLVFSLGGAVFGMGEEAIAFAMIVVPLVVALGYDGIVGVMITYGATQVGFATSWQNPFSLLVAQGVAGIPIMSGWQVRVGLYVFFLLFSIVWVTLYALKVQRDPLKSLSYASDAYFRNDIKHTESIHVKFGLSHALVLLSLVAGIVWIVWGVTGYGAGNGYYIAEIATVFFTVGLAAGVIGVIFKMNNMTVNDIASSFKDGVRDIISAAIIVGLAKGVILVLGGDQSADMTVFNTMINGVSSTLKMFPSVIGAWMMYLFTAIFNFFVTSGSAKAGLIVPVLSVIADQLQISRQIACLSFQLGDGFTNMIVPTSGALMGSLAAARMDWTTWAKFQWKLQLIYFGFGSLIVIGAVIFNFS